MAVDFTVARHLYLDVVMRVGVFRVAVGLSFLLHLLVFWCLGLGVFSGLTNGMDGQSSVAVRTQFLTEMHARLLDVAGARMDGVEPPSQANRQMATRDALRSDLGTPGRDDGSVRPVPEADITGRPRQAPQPRYHSPDELTEVPQALGDTGSATPSYIPDVYPLPVVVQILIDDRGRVAEVILGENFLSEIAKNYIVESISGMKFKPGMIGVRPVRSRMQIVVQLEPTIPLN